MVDAAQSQRVVNAPDDQAGVLERACDEGRGKAPLDVPLDQREPGVSTSRMHDEAE